MAVTAARVTVGITPTLLSVGAETDFMSGRTIVVTNLGPGDLYLGGDDVDESDGYPLPTGATFSADLAGEALYGIVSSGTQDVPVLQGGL